MREDPVLKAFLKAHALDDGSIDMEKCLQEFCREMDLVRSRKKSTDHTVKMIPTDLGVFTMPERETSVTVIDIGGTNVRSAVLTMDRQGIRIEERNSFLTPGIKDDIDSAQFFREIAEGVKSSLRTDRVGICFSLAAEPVPDRDAVVVAGGKQLRITDIIGKKVGESFQSALKEIGISGRKDITVVNDTIAAALAGQGEAFRDHVYGGFMGFIYGTGTNLCYREPSGLMINVESGAYCGFPSGDLDDLFDAELIDAGDDRFEKMVSGGYQGGLAEKILQCAAAEGLLTQETYRNIIQGEEKNGPARQSQIDSRDISAFSYEPEGDGKIARACTCEEDRERLLELFDSLTARSACLCCITITGALMHTQRKGKSLAPVWITAEGSTYLKQKGFREALEARMQEFAGKRHSLSYEFHQVDDAVFKGIAAACLSR